MSFKVDEATSKAWVEDALKNISKKDLSLGATIMANIIKKVHSTPHNVKATINGKNSSKTYEWLSPPEPLNGVRF